MTSRGKITKAQERRREKYLAQLKKCGFRSWKRANARRFELIECYADGDTADAAEEWFQLQQLCRLYVAWKTNDSLGREIRRLNKQGLTW